MGANHSSSESEHGKRVVSLFLIISVKTLSSGLNAKVHEAFNSFDLDGNQTINKEEAI
jgi:Ca2+-binding EF-hand superfamily protein